MEPFGPLRSRLCRMVETGAMTASLATDKIGERQDVVSAVITTSDSRVSATCILRLGRVQRLGESGRGLQTYGRV